MAKHNSIETKILELINKYRASKDLEPMEWHDMIQEKAKSHVQNIVDNKTPFGHEKFSERVHSLFLDLGATGAAENIARGQETAEQVVEHWLKSPLHKKNIDGNYNLTGIAVQKDAEGRQVFVHIFIRGTAPKILSKDKQLEDAERQVEALINNYRKTNNKTPFQTHVLIQEIARNHARAMATGQIELGHDGFKDRAHRIMQVMNGRGAAENVARWSGAPEQVVDHWLDSPNHRKNIDGNYQLASIGIAEAEDGSWYFTQIFIRTK